MRVGEISYAQMTIHNMVREFVNEHMIEWDRVREEKRLESVEHFKKIYPLSDYKGIAPGRSLSLQSYIASDLLIDFMYLAESIEVGNPFLKEYWIRSNGIQCINSRKDVSDNRAVWNDVLAKFIVEFDGKKIVRIEWFQDNDCLLQNKLITDDSKAKSLSYSSQVK